MSTKKGATSVVVFLGDSTIVDPLVHALVDERMGSGSQSLDFEIFRFGERPVADIESALRQVGMFTARRCVWLRGFSDAKRRAGGDGPATSKASDEDGGADDGPREDGDEETGGAGDLLSLLEGGIPDGTLLVISAAGLDARSRLSKWLTKNAEVVDRRVQVDRGGKLGEEGMRRAIADRLAELGVTRVAGGVVDEIFRRSGNVLGETMQEIDRLVMSLPDPAQLSVADVRSRMRDLALGWVFDLTKALEGRNLAAAEDLISRLLAEGEAPLRLSSLLSTHVAQLIAVRPVLDKLPPGALRMQGAAFLSGPGASLPEAVKGWKGYFRLKAAANFSAQELRGLHGRLLQLDLALKSSPAPPLLLFSRFLQAACIPGSAS